MCRLILDLSPAVFRFPGQQNMLIAQGVILAFRDMNRAISLVKFILGSARLLTGG